MGGLVDSLLSDWEEVRRAVQEDGLPAPALGCAQA